MFHNLISLIILPRKRKRVCFKSINAPYSRLIVKRTLFKRQFIRESFSHLYNLTETHKIITQKPLLCPDNRFLTSEIKIITDRIFITEYV